MEIARMKARIIFTVGLAAATLIGCGSTPPPSSSPPPVGTSALPVPPPATVAPGASAAPVPAAPGVIRMYPVMRIHSLIDVSATEGGIELRLGEDPGGGMVGRFRYVPIVNGAPDFAQETDEISRADTTGGYIEVAGRRPGLIYHVVSGFRSAASDRYQVLGANNLWGIFAVNSSPGVGIGISPWSKDRLLEWRGPSAEEVAEGLGARLPRLRVLQGADKEAPSLPGNLKRRLTEEGFFLDTFKVFRTGEVLAVGRLSRAKSFGTVLWTEKPRDPRYFEAEAESLTQDSELRFLGGDSLTNVRLQVDERWMRFDGSAWVLDSAVPDGSLPDVWFGSTQLIEKKSLMFARLAPTSPWLPLEAPPDPKRVEQSFAVDPSGTIWKNEDDLLLSSKPPEKPLKEITEEDLVNARKARGQK
jgi:hypothetical protein